MIQNIEGIEFELSRRKVKYLRIQVMPPDGKVKVISPYGLSQTAINEFVGKRSAWIKKHQFKFLEQKPKNELLFKSGETHYLWGQAYELCVFDSNNKGRVYIVGNLIKFYIWPDADINIRTKLMDRFYKAQLNQLIPDLMSKWENIIQVKASSFYIRKMKTKWGSCNVVSKRIAFNLELAKKPVQCLEYVIVHELVHLLEASHNARFKGFMDKYLPDWRERKKLLNS